MAPPTAERHRFVVAPEDDGARLDRVLALRVPGLSRTRARVLLDLGGVFVDGARVKVASRAVRAGQTIEAYVGGALERATKDVGQKARARDDAALPEPVIVHADDDVVVIDKPAALLAAPTPESDRGNAQALLARRFGRIWVVHRLDLGTSGLLIYARTPDANRVLSETFRAHDLEREYLAALAGTLGAVGDVRSVELPIEGRAASTRFTVIEDVGAIATSVRCRLGTGRTHQIRIHAQHLGHPVMGDRLHGIRTDHDPPRLALHATRLALRHPRTGAPLDFTSPLPEDLARWLDGLRRAA